MIKFFIYGIKTLRILTFAGIYFLLPKKLKGKYILNIVYILGPTYIKLGQSLSTRPDVVGEDIAKNLSLLQDNVPSFSVSNVKKRIEKSFKQPFKDIFKEFNEVPHAAASISQVHQAVTKEGKKVAVKILRPNIKRLFIKDIKYFYFGAYFLDYFTKFKRLKFPQVIKLFEDTVIHELNLTNEAASASELKDNLKNDGDVYIPEIDWSLTTHDILVSEWIEGIPIYDTDKLQKNGHNLVRLSEILAITFFNQTYRDGFFHADLHPGNILVSPKGTIVFIDFGIMGRFDYETRIFVAEILRGFINRDYEHVSDIHFAAGYIPKDQSRSAFATACRAIGEPIVGCSARDISVANLLGQLFRMTEEFQMETQIQLLWFQKSLIVIEGVLSSLNPNVNMWQLAEPWIRDWAKNNLSVKAKIKRLSIHAKDTFEELYALKKNLNLLNDYIENKIKYEKKEKLSYNTRILYTIIFINLILISYLLLKL